MENKCRVSRSRVSHQELETVLWAVCRVEHRADDLVSAMAVEVIHRQTTRSVERAVLSAYL